MTTPNTTISARVKAAIAAAELQGLKVGWAGGLGNMSAGFCDGVLILSKCRCANDDRLACDAIKWAIMLHANSDRRSRQARKRGDSR